MNPFVLEDTPLLPQPMLLEASAGTGKTFALVGIVMRLLLERKIDGIGRALVVTFTVAATEELRTRLWDGLQRARAACAAPPDGTTPDFFAALGRRHGADGLPVLDRAIAEFDQLTVATIHGFCHQLLAAAAFESGTTFESEFVADDGLLLRAAVQDALRDLLQGDDGVLAALLQTRNDAAQQLTDQLRRRHNHPTARWQDTAPLAVTLATIRDALRAAAGAFDARALADWLTLLAPSNRSKLLKLEPHAPWAEQFGIVLRESPLAALPLCDELGGIKAPAAPPPLVLHCRRIAEQLDQAWLALRVELDRRMLEAQQRVQIAANVATFGDLVRQVAAALDDPPRRRMLLAKVEATWDHALIDEFQDTDPVQYSIFKTCFQGRGLYLIGDPKQSIYAFRGADVRAYLQARDQCRLRYTLTTNWRSHPELVAAVATLFRNRPLPFAQAGIEVAPVEPARSAAEMAITGDTQRPLQIVLAETGQAAAVPGHVTAAIVRLLTDGLRIDGRPLRPRDIAILTRRNVEAVQMQDALRAAGVHSAISRAGDIFVTEELEEVERLLLAIVHGTHRGRLFAAMASVLWGGTLTRIDTCRRDDDALDRELARLSQWRTVWPRHGFMAMVEQVFGDLDVRARLLARPDGERRLTNYLQIAELLHEAASETHLSPEALLQWLRYERAQQELDYQRRELRLESDADAVQIQTLHGSKGLEYEIVFCPFLGTMEVKGLQLVHGERGPGTLTVVDRKTDLATWLRAAENSLAEDLRLLYVGLTRARRRCHIYGHVPDRAEQVTALGYLLCGPGADRPEDWVLAVREDVKSIANWRHGLAALLHAHPQGVEMNGLVAQPPPSPLPRTDAPARVRPRAMPGPLGESWRKVSFTQLSRRHDETGELDEYRDPDPADAAEAAAPAQGFFAFARGAKAGVCLHSLLEHLDWRNGAGDRELVARALQQAGLLPVDAHRGQLDPVADTCRMLAALRDTVPDAPPVPFRELLTTHPRHEWRFHLAVDRLDPRALARVFRAHGDAVSAAHAEPLERLSGRAASGFLTGSADVICAHGGRYYVIDWKSNWLGNTFAGYGPLQLLASMHEHHYVLQYHLYLLALHRHLRRQLRDYDPERHLGGTIYVYLRGIGGGDRGSGTFAHRPPSALILALDRWAQGAAP